MEVLDGRLPLMDEKIVIANLLSGQYKKYGDKFKPELFNHEYYSFVAELIGKELAERGVGGFSIQHIRDKLSGGQTEMNALLKEKYPAENMDDCYRIMKEYQQRRKLLQTANELVAQLKDDKRAPSEIMQDITQKLVQSHSRLDSISAETQFDVNTSYHEERMLIQSGKKRKVIPLSNPALTQVIGGVEPGNLILLAARPSTGKTAFMLQEARTWAKMGYAGMIFSLEQSNEQLTRRNVAAVGDIDMGRLKETIGDDDLSRESKALSELNNLPIYYVDKRGLSVEDICTQARIQKVRDPKLAWLAIDFLTLVRTQNSAYSSKHLEIEKIVRTLRDLAGELNLWIMLLSQLNRGLENRDNKRPRLSDLRESGTIEEYADMVLSLYRHYVYYPDYCLEPWAQQVVEVAVLKNRDGASGHEIISNFDGAKMRFGPVKRENVEAYKALARGGR